LSRTFDKGLVVGKFCPLHRGHQLVIDRAIARCRQTVLLSYTNPVFPRCGAAARRRWLETLYPDAIVLVPDADLPSNDADAEIHRRFVAQMLARDGHEVDAVFTSESYGEPFALALARLQEERTGHTHRVAHVPVDPGRLQFPICGTQLRGAVGPFEGLLSGVVAADMVARICLLGGESTGKTILAQALAAALGEPWVPEYGRERWEERGGRLAVADLADIGREQVRREEVASLVANRFVVCDTSPLTTLFYSLDLFGRAAPGLEALAMRTYDLVVLCGAEFGFVQDGTRRDSAFREKGQGWYREALAARGMGWIEVTGAVPQRLDRLLAQAREIGLRYDAASPRQA
jgi:HTH-type transcriptional repressor of NAD biosynthesis genes